MSRQLQLLFGLALVAVFAATTVSALKCASCTQTKEDDCSDPSSANTKEEVCQPGANGEKPYCRLMIQNVQGTVTYVRQCGSAAGGMKKPYYNTANDYVKASVYHCDDKDLCNGATSFFVSKMAAVGVVAIAWMLH